jgi:hypothetical protein
MLGSCLNGLPGFFSIRRNKYCHIRQGTHQGYILNGLMGASVLSDTDPCMGCGNLDIELWISDELRICSKALPVAKTAKVLAKGTLPAAANPAENPIKFCSAIPILKNRCGKTLAKSAVLVDLDRSASSTTTSAFSPPSCTSALP